MSLDGTKVMVADDERVIRRMVTAKLSGLGCRVTEVVDGREAMDSLNGGETPDVLVTDNLMPRLSGLQLVRELRDSANSDLSTLPIIMLTARQSEQDIIEGLEAGLDDYVIKPFSPEELAARVRTVLWRTKGRPS